MFVNLMQFGQFVLFGLLKVSVGQALFGETRSDVTLVIEFEYYSWSRNEINIYFHQFQCSLPETEFNAHTRVMTITNNGVQCLSNFGYYYKTRIVNASINCPTYVTFGLRNVSVYDSGWYYAQYNTFHKTFERRILHVGDTILRTCTFKQMEFEFVLPLSVFNETVAFVFCGVIHRSKDIISICNPEAGTCVPHSRATFPRVECKMNGSRITITLTSVQMEDEGLYALIGSTSRIVFQSAVLHVIECVSTSAAFDVEFNTTELPNLTTIYAPVNNIVTLYSTAIISTAAPITDKLFENYFVGGGVVAGMTIVILICWLLWKRLCITVRCETPNERWYEIRGNGAGGDDYDTVDVHYYCSIRNQNEPVTESEAITVSVPESQQLSALMDKTTVYDNI